MTRARDELVLSHAADYGGGAPGAVAVRPGGARPAAGRRRRPGGGRATADRRIEAAGARPAARRAPPASRRHRRAAHAVVLRDRRLPHLPAEVQVRPRPPGAGRAAPLDDLRRGAPQGGPGVPPAPRPRRRHDRGGAVRGVRGRLDERGLPVARARGRRLAGREALRRFRASSWSPGAVIPAYVERSSASPRRRPGPGPLGPGRHRAGGRPGRAGPGRGRAARRSRRHGLADARADRPRAGDDHRLQVERRPRPGEGAPARPGLAPAPDLRDGLRGADGSAAGRRPAPLPRLRACRAASRSTRSGSSRRGRRSPPRPPGSAPGDFTAKPDRSTCGYCPFREICPSSVAT